jgi:hypothetical protein
VGIAVGAAAAVGLAAGLMAAAVVRHRAGRGTGAGDAHHDTASTASSRRRVSNTACLCQHMSAIDWVIVHWLGCQGEWCS